MINTPLEHKIVKIVKPVIEDLGFSLVLVEYAGGVLQILAENPQTRRLGIDDCTIITKAISPLLEVEDPIISAYTLEISSPGIDRPLITAEDFQEYVGFEVKAELDMPTESGQKRFRGKILSEKDGLVKLLVDGKEHDLEINNLRKARLVLTDELIKATKKEQPVTEPTTETQNA